MESKTKPISISKHLVYESYKAVASHKGAAGVDGVCQSEFDKDLKNNLYKIWNRLSSGSYFPPAVRSVEIPKRAGGKRPLGIPTISDRIAQGVIKRLIEPRFESVFHKDSYGYRPKKSAHDALRACRMRTWKTDWVVDLDIKGFFDNIDHDKLMVGVSQLVKEEWILVYLRRWLEAKVSKSGHLEPRTKGTPQGGVISPLLANIFLHYTFDKWMNKYYPSIEFERYADDIVVHTRSQEESEQLLEKIAERFEECGLQIHPEKSKVVYCKDRKRTGNYRRTSFDFLGFTFRPRLAANKKGMYYVGFLPGISHSSARSIRREIKRWRLQDKVKARKEDIAKYINPKVQGWINYYSLFNKRDLNKIFQLLNYRLLKWIRAKYKSLRTIKKSVKWLKAQISRDPKLFSHWAFMYVRFE